MIILHFTFMTSSSTGTCIIKQGHSVKADILILKLITVKRDLFIQVQVTQKVTE